MFHARGAIARCFDRIREEGRELDVVELAERLLSLRAPLERPLARRLLAAALECPPGALPDRLTALDLAAIRHGVLSASHGPLRHGQLGVPLARACFSVVDLETTGLSERCSIIEIGAVRVEALRVTARFETLAAPDDELPAAVCDLTGIDRVALADAPRQGAALSALQRWLAARPHAAFVAHNAAFDAGFLRRGFDAHGLPPLRVPVLCTRRLGRRLMPRLRVYNLDALCAQFGISNRARHRALGDAEATALLLIELLALLRTSAPEASLLDLLVLQERPPARPSARGR